MNPYGHITITFRIDCDYCAVETTKTCDVGVGMQVPNPHFDGWRVIDGKNICPSHEIAIDPDVTGKVVRAVNNLVGKQVLFRNY